MGAAAGITPGAMARDVLCELFNIGAGHGWMMTSRLLKEAPIIPGVPGLLRANEWLGAAGDADGTIIVLAVEGGVDGHFVLAFDEASARHLSAKLLADGEVARIEPIHESALREVGNIASCGFLDTLSAMLGLSLVPTPPAAATGRLSDLLAPICPPDALAVGCEFNVRGANIHGRLLWVLDRTTAAQVVERAGMAEGPTAIAEL